MEHQSAVVQQDCAANHQLNYSEDKLCKYCMRFMTWSWEQYRGRGEIVHRPSFSNLCDSAASGCKLCAALEKGWLEYNEIEDGSDRMIDLQRSEQTEAFRLALEDVQQNAGLHGCLGLGFPSPLVRFSLNALL